jgi:hypothetical protein
MLGIIDPQIPATILSLITIVFITKFKEVWLGCVFGAASEFFWILLCLEHKLWWILALSIVWAILWLYGVINWWKNGVK